MDNGYTTRLMSVLTFLAKSWRLEETDIKNCLGCRPLIISSGPGETNLTLIMVGTFKFNSFLTVRNK